jgi:hypothetical protein
MVSVVMLPTAPGSMKTAPGAVILGIDTASDKVGMFLVL